MIRGPVGSIVWITSQKTGNYHWFRVLVRHADGRILGRNDWTNIPRMLAADEWRTSREQTDQRWNDEAASLAD